MSNDTKKDDEAATREARTLAVPPRHARRKLLAATVGLAFVSMVGAGCGSGNLMSPDTGHTDADQDDEDASEDR
ncbi:MAG: hypothetical protein J0L92_18060 [Deltaproteobacteria bacterium]|nr:hypothetical protein [Deltaproteobacteria bacterium]